MRGRESGTFLDSGIEGEAIQTCRSRNVPMTEFFETEIRCQALTCTSPDLIGQTLS